MEYGTNRRENEKDREIEIVKVRIAVVFRLFKCLEVSMASRNFRVA